MEKLLACDHKAGLDSIFGLAFVYVFSLGHSISLRTKMNRFDFDIADLNTHNHQVGPHEKAR